jgi:hypothetical protein
MNNLDFIWNYAHACGNGRLAMSECEPVWQFGVIALFLALAITTFIVLRMRSTT